MESLEQNVYRLSLELGISENSEPPVELFQQYYNNPLNFTDAQKQELADFSFSLMTLAKENDTTDKAGIDYIAKFLNYYCPTDNSIAKLNEQGQQSVLSVFNSDSSVIKEAIKASNCTR